MTAAQQVRVVLAKGREHGEPFEHAWITALRYLEPPRDAAPAVMADYRDTKAVLREAKPYFLAAYELRAPTPDELADGLAHADRRLRDLVEGEPDFAELAGG